VRDGVSFHKRCQRWNVGPPHHRVTVMSSRHDQRGHGPQLREPRQATRARCPVLDANQRSSVEISTGPRVTCPTPARPTLPARGEYDANSLLATRKDRATVR